MDTYTASADKLRHELHHLNTAMYADEPNLDLALAAAKRVRREATVLVRALARQRDSYSPEGTST